MTHQELNSLKEDLLNSSLGFYDAQNYMDIEGDIENAKSIEALQTVVDDLEEWAATLEALANNIRKNI